MTGLWRVLLYCWPGLFCSVTGFVFISGPHRRPNLGVSLYFCGIALFVIGAFLAV